VRHVTLTLLCLCTTPALAQPVLKMTEAAAAPEEKPSPLVQEAQVNFSGLLNYGNINLLSGKVSGFYQIKLLRHSLRVEGAAGAAGQATDTDANPANGFETSLQENLNTLGNARIRYDFYITPADTVYTSYLLAHDTATNLTMRNRVEGGYRRFLFQQPKHSLSMEMGLAYSLDYAPLDGDTNHDGKVSVFDDRSRFEVTGGTVAGRLMVAYSVTVLDILSLNQTVELFPNLFPYVEAPFESTRGNPSADNKLGLLEATVLTSNTAINVSLTKNISAGMVLTFVYDNGAIARRNAVSNADMALAGSLGLKL